MSVELDLVDKGILRMLQNDGRTSFSSIAKELDLNESTIRYRVKKLLDKQVITKFAALLDPTKIGLPVTAVIMIKLTPDLFEGASREIADLNETRHVFQSTGGYDIITVVNTRDLKHLSKLRLRLEMISGVTDVLVFATTRLLKIKTFFDL